MKKNMKSGQSTVEFVLSLTLMIGFVLSFLQLSLVFAYGNYVHYATFMAARALLAAGPSANDQQERAQTYIATMLRRSAAMPGIERFPSIAKGQGGSSSIAGLDINLPGYYNENDPDSSWAQGVRYTFKSQPIFPLPLGIGATGSSQTTVTLKSESWLGREVTTDSCAADLMKRDAMHQKGIFDNGC